MADTEILVIEDEEKIARVLELELTYEGYGVSKAHSGYDALELYRCQQWDLIILDIMLPEMSGIELLRRIRKNDQHTPILLLTAKDSTEDKVTGLDLGANDYITKPFEIEELLARIRAALRQIKNNEGQEDDGWLSFEDLKLNQSTREVYRGERFIELTPREFDLLVYFLNHKRQVLTRDQIMDAVWGFDYVGDTNVVDVYVRYLRKKIDSKDDDEIIHTVRGVGYVLKDPYETKK